MSETAIVGVCMLVAGFGLGAAIMCLVYWISFETKPEWWEKQMRLRRLRRDMEQVMRERPTSRHL